MAESYHGLRAGASQNRMTAASSGPEWRHWPGLVDYPQAVAAMEERVARIAAGTSARAVDLLDPGRFPVFATGRGGQYTYHGPGQRVVYVMFDLNTRGRDVRAFVGRLEAWVIATLAAFGVTGEVRPGRVGVWVARPDRPPGPDGAPAEDKIAANGVKLRRWVSFHGLAINVEPDLGHFDGIVPCGIRGHGVTSLVDLGLPVSMADVDVALRETFGRAFG